jgi:hypothetical protein
VQLHYHEEVLQKARAQQRTTEQKRALRESLRPRAKVERKIAEVLRLHGLRQGRYLGLKKTDQQAVMTAAMVNAKRLFTLSAEDEDLADGLREALGLLEASRGPGVWSGRRAGRNSISAPRSISIKSAAS